jgi:hypothetical protein
MQAGHAILGLNISEWAAIVNAVTVVILVFINIDYLRIAKHQAEATHAQAKESQRQADVAMENLKLAEAQAEQLAAQELTTVAILRGIVVDVTFWLPIVKENWKTAPSSVRLVPGDHLIGSLFEPASIFGKLFSRRCVNLIFVRAR